MSIAPHQEIRVLHVDDEPDFADLTTAFLERESDRFTVETATSADDGLETLTDRPPDCVVSDYNMPGMDGIEFLRAVREDNPDLPFILYTGKGSETVASEAIAANVTDYLQKGSGSEQYELLANRIRNAVQARHETERADRQEQLMRLTEFAGDTGGFELHTETGELLLTDGVRRLIDLPAQADLSLDEAIDLYHPEDQADIRQAITRACQTGEQTHGTWRLQLADGDERLVDVTFTPTTADGDTEILRGSVHDITEQRERQEELRRSERRLNALLEHSTDRISVMNADGCYTYVSPSAETLMGHDPAELTGEEAFEYIHPEDRAKTRETFQQILDDPDGIYGVEYRYRDAEGSWRWVESRGTNRLDDPAIEGVVINSREITDRKEREQELQRTRDLMANMEQMADAGAWEYDSETDSLMLTDGAYRLHGRNTDEDLTLGEAFDAIHPDDRDRLRDRFDACLETGEPYEIEIRLTTPDGGQRWITARGERVTTDGNSSVVRGYIQDITEQTEQQQELERRTELFEKAQQIADIGAWAHDIERGTLTWTDQVYDIHGVSGEFDPSLDDVEALYHPEDQPKLREAHNQAVTAGEPYDLEVRMTAGDDEIRWIRTVADPQVESGDVVRVRGTVHDITDRKEREKELQRITNQYQTLVKNFSDGAVFLFDTDNQYVRAGGQELTAVGLSSEEVSGETPYDLFPGEIAEETVRYYQETLDGASHTFEQEYGGEQYRIQTVPVRTSDGEITYGMAVSRNITERTERRQELERQKERLEEFASVVSHDLRNPLRVAEGRLELAQTECDSPHLDDVADAIDRSQALIEDVLTLAREGEDVSEVEPVELADVAESSWQTVEASHATLETHATQTLHADESRLKQLFENLYRNAIEHGGDDVTVSVGPMDGGFYVADTGPGIPEDDREEVFEPGYSTNEEGTGFGLRIVEQVADAHGWEVTVTESEQGGARFEITGVEFADC